MIPGLPYTQLALGAVILLLLVAYGWAMKRWGRSAEQARMRAKVLQIEREVHGAVGTARETPVKVDDEWLRRRSP